MERRKALALAATITCVLGSTTVAVAAVGGTALLGFGGGHHARLSVLGPTGSGASLGAAAGVITRTKDVYDTVTLQSAAGLAGATPARPAGLISAALPTSPVPGAGARPTVTPDAGAPKYHRHGSTTPPRSQPSPPKTPRTPSTPTTPTTSTTQPPPGPPATTTTTLAPVTTTTRPPGVPADWPPNKPIPPMPPNCRQPQLEDNGVWNCQGN